MPVERLKWRAEMELQIRAGTADDAAGVLEVYRPWVEETAISFELTPPTTEEMTRRITERGDRYPWLVAEEGDTIMGYAYGAPFASRAAYDWSVETSVYLAPHAAGRGLGTRLYATLLPILEAQGFRRFQAGITLPNDASVRLHERFGFQSVGVHHAIGWKFGRWHDVGRWERLVGGDTPPTPITPFSGLPDDPAAPI
jgi:L-amino acid N-acyltransferase YncA